MKHICKLIFPAFVLLVLLAAFAGCEDQHVHSMGDWSVTTAATCAAAGEERRDCAGCEHFETRPIAKTEHSMGEWSVTTAATCAAAGEERRDCAGCEHFETRSTTKAEHSMGDWSVTTAATCAAAGEERRDCANCEYYETKVVAVTGHTYATEWTYDEMHHWHAATCEHNGEISGKTAHDYDANYVCKVCAYVDTSLHGVEIKAEGFAKEGNNYSIALPNATETYSFIGVIETAKTASFAVYRDLECSQMIVSKTAGLAAGDNVFYILVTNGNDLGLYTFTIRRRPIYPVSFDTKGSTVPAQQIEEGGKATAPDAPTREGYTFDGWDFDFNAPVTEEKTIVAKWQVITYSITYNLNGGTNAEGNPKNYTIESDAITLAAPTRTGYIFKGWTDGGSIAAGSTGNKTFTANWEIIVYTITYNLNGGTNAGGNPTSYTVESNAITLAAPTRTGYTFKGWTDGGSIAAGSTGKKTFTAMWEANTYTVVFDAGVGEVTPQSMSVIFDAQTDLPAPVSNSCAFLGWYYGETKVTSGEWKIAENVTLTAKWRSFFVINNSGIITGLTTAGKQQATLVIPSEIDGRSVVGIGNSAFEKCTSLVSITIPASVTSIGSSAFSVCRSLTSITIPSSVESIGEGAFSGCSGLESITLPFVGGSPKTASDTYQYPFGYIFGTNSYTGGVENTQRYYGSSTNSTTSTAYYIPESLKTVTVTGGEILRGAFCNCTNLASITIPSSVTSIGEWAFYNCTSLASITIPPMVTSIGSSAFSGCTSLATVTFAEGSSLTSIGYSAFKCTSLASVTIPPSVTSIGFSAFSGCTSLVSITIPSSVTSIGSGAFYRTAWYENQPDGLVYAGNVAYDYKGTMPSGTSIVLRDGTTGIAEYAFSGCTNLTSITIPSSVTSIGEWAFQNCTSLTSITIPSSVESIGSYAFHNCTSLVSITIPSSVTRIDYRAFCGCTSLATVTFADGSRLESIGADAFYYCTSLTSITIPSSVTSIGERAFSGCSGLESITLPFLGGSRKTASATGQYPFGYIFGTSSYTGGVETSQWYYGSSTSYTTSTTYYIPESLKTVTITGGEILYGAFHGCKNLASITIPPTVTSIGDNAFSWCTSLKSIIIPSSVTSIGEYAFRGCTSLASITIPSSVTSIGDYAFDYCYKLVEVYNLSSLSIAKGSTSNGYVGYYAKDVYTDANAPSKLSTDAEGFVIYADGAQKILMGYTGKGTALTIPNEITEIYKYAFYENRVPVSITIPASVTRIGYSAFEGCYKLVEVYNLSSLSITKGSWSNGNVGYYAKDVYTDASTPSKLSTDADGFVIYADGDVKSLIAYTGNKIILTIPEGVTEINQYAFEDCTSLTSITIPSSVTSIGEDAFRGCTSLATVTFAEGSRLTSIGVSAFSGTAWYENQPYGLVYAGNVAYDYKGTMSSGTSIVLRDGTTGIADYAFDYCKSLFSIAIPSSVTSIGNYAFRDCTSLATVTFAEGSRLTSIGRSAFYGCTRLLSITIPSSVTSIGSSAFSGCTSLTIYCQVSSKPSGWASSWNPSNRPVVWGYKD